MSNTDDLVNSAATGNLQEFKEHFSELLAEKSVNFLSARSGEVSRGLVTECDCGCDADLEEVTKLHPDTHKIKKTKYGYQLFIYSPSTGKFIPQGPPHKTKRAAEKDAEKFESFELDEATKWKMGDGRPRGGARIENVRFWNLPKDQLQYIIKDAGEAMRSNPKARKATTGPGNWADQVNDASTVLAWRKKNNIKESVELEEEKVSFRFKGSKSEREKIRTHLTNKFNRDYAGFASRAGSQLDISFDAKNVSKIVKYVKSKFKDNLMFVRQKDGYDYNESVELDEATLKFDSGMSGKSGEFIRFITNKKLGQVKKVKGKFGAGTVEVTPFRESDTGKIKKAASKYGMIGESNLQSIVNSASTEMPIDIDIDGNTIHITPDISERIVNLHDELNESNQKDMIDMLESDKSSFLKIVKFAQRRQQ